MGLWLFTLLGLICSVMLFSVDGANEILFSGWIVWDETGIYLSFIALLFIVCFSMLASGTTSLFESTCLVTSLIFSILCFFSGNTIVFWISYELAIIPLLISLYASSPYSERYLAGWYLMSYILITSLPMLLCILSISISVGSFSISECGGSNGALNVVLLILFMTKVPLPPFHSWLPVVHAEASSYVSICLSGYIMKLGIVGLYRFCFFSVEKLGYIVVLMFVFSLLFFYSASSELDTKRWLAFLSLSHILVALVGLFYLRDASCYLVMFYCLGHGLSAGLLFYLFLNLYEVCGTRNWLLISMSDSSSVSWRLMVVLGVLTVSSFPPSISFISEVIVLSSSMSNTSMLLAFCPYLFLGGLVPMVLLSSFVSNISSYGKGSEYFNSCLVVIFVLFLLWFIGGVII